MKKTFVLFLMLVLTLCVGAQAASLPEGYTEVEYIESQGAGYIDTGWNTAGVTSSYGYELSYMPGEKNPGIDSFFFGAYDMDAELYRMGIMQMDTNGTTRLAFGETNANNSAAVHWDTELTKQTVKVDVNKSGSTFKYSVAKDGTAAGVTNAAGTIAGTPLSDKNVWVGALGNGLVNGVYNRMSGKIYGLKLWEDGALVRDFVPCYEQSTDIAGLYDTVEGKFYHCPYERNFSYPGQEKALVAANAGIVVNTDTGEIYYGQHIDRRHGQASMTKIMTAVLTIENVPDVSERALVAIDMDHDDGSSMKLVTGEQHTIDDVLYGMMLPSGNDAAQLLARTVGHRLGGTFGTFVDMMNAKAHELGMVNTVYDSPQGGYQTTAYDYAKLGEYAMRNELFRKYAYESFWTIEADPEYNVVEHNLTNANQLMPGLPYEYEGITGIKPGGTQPTRAHNTATATRIVNGKEVNLIVVVLGTNANEAHRNRFTECTTLLDYGFEAAKNQPYTVTAEGNKLTIYNPVSGYTVEAVISAADTAYTGEPIEAAVVDTTYTYGTWNPNWEIVYENNVEKGTATASITYDGQTASCTFEIVEPAVTLTEDTAVDTLVVPTGQVYDLNNHALSVANGLTVNEGGKIVNGEIAVAQGAVVSLGSNGGWVPVWYENNEGYDCYELYPAEIKAGKSVVSTDEGTQYSFGYKFSDNGREYNPYADSVAASENGKIKFGVALDLDDANADYIFSGESIAKMQGINAAASSDEFFKVNLKLAGSNNPLTKVRLAPVIKVKELGFRFVGEDTGEAVADGEYVARVDDTFYWSLEDAVAAAGKLSEERNAVVDIMVTKDINFERPVTIETNGMVAIKTHCDVTISGPVTFDGKGKDNRCQLFFVGKDGALTLDGVKVVNYKNICSDGSTRAYGALARVEVMGTLNMNNCTVTNCESPNRGIIYVTGNAKLNVDGCSFSGNTAKTQYGGVIGAYTSDGISVKNSTFSGNSCAQYGGAIGIREAVSLTVENCTFTGNSGKTAAGAIRSAADKTTLVGLTMSGNVGAGKAGYDIYLPSGKAELGGKNAIGTISLSEGVSIALKDSFALAEGAEKIRIDGVVGETVLTGSKVAEACGSFAGVTDDITVTEQGVLKSSKNYVAQVGETMYESMFEAFEATKNATKATTINLIGSESFETATTLTLGKYVNVVVAGKDVTISGPVTIDGQGVTNLSGTHTISVEDHATLTLDGVTVKGIVSQTATSGALRAYIADLVLNNTTVENCTGVRGAVYMAGTTKLTITGCTFKNNTATDRGGALFLYGASNPTTVKNTTFIGNSAAGNGDTVFITNGATLNFADSTVSGEGSCVYVSSGTFAISGEIAIDSVELVGGQTVALNDELSITGTVTVIGNPGQKVLSGSKVADYYEKFVSANEGEVIDETGLLLSTSGVVNVAKVDGVGYTSLAAAVAKAKEIGVSDVELVGSEKFTEATTIALGNIRLVVNKGQIAQLSGPLTLTGGDTAVHIIYVNGGSLALNGVTVKDHTNNDSNGAIAVANKGTITLDNCVIENLEAKRGALYLNGSGGAFSISATNTTFKNNTSTTFGGAVSTYSGITSTFTNCTFTGNVAESYGGAFASYNASSSDTAVTTFTNCTFTDNESLTAGSGAAYLRGTVTINGGSMSGNKAASNAGAVHFYVKTATVTGLSVTDNTAGDGEAAIRLANSGKLTLDGVTASGNSTYDVNVSTGTLTLKGATEIGKISLASGKKITPDAGLTLSGDKPIGVVAAGGASVLTGSGVSAAYDKFAVVDASGTISDTLTINASGTVVSK